MENEKSEPWIWLQDGEEQGECEKLGIKLIRDYRGSESPAVIVPALVEAAPDLLAALKNALKALSTGGIDNTADVREQARAAIAKATGGNT